MNKPAALSVDVVIPVFNAPELTKRCIDSVMTHLKQSIGTVYVQDDASSDETRAMLDDLRYPQVHIYHAPENQGFGKSVNDAVARSDADLVFVLNSDTEIDEDFLPVLCAAFVADPELAAISPGHKNFFRHELERYLRRPGGYVQTYRFKGHAFLIRRDIFMALGGFDLQFGRGYFEDLDLSRRLDQQGWRMGVHPDTHIDHQGGGSFGRGQFYRALMKRNRALYLARYPGVCRNVLMISANNPVMDDLPTELSSAIEFVFSQGGSIHWLTPLPLPQLFCLQMRNSRISILTIFKLMLRGGSRKDKRISEVWILPDTPGVWRILLALFIRGRKLKMQTWN